MKKIKILIGIILIMSALSGCEPKEKSIQKEEKSYNTYFIKISSEYCGDIVYDSRTGVQYWRSAGVYNGGTLTLLVDADGKPLIYKEEK